MIVASGFVTTFVASSLPPSPVSRIVKSAGWREKATKAEVLVPGQVLKLRVIDGDMNLSPIRRDKVLATLKPAHGGQQIVVLEETGVATGVFGGMRSPGRTSRTSTVAAAGASTWRSR